MKKIILDFSYRCRLFCAGRLLRLAGRGRGLWPWLPVYMILMDIEKWLKK